MTVGGTGREEAEEGQGGSECGDGDWTLAVKRYGRWLAYRTSEGKDRLVRMEAVAALRQEHWKDGQGRQHEYTHLVSHSGNVLGRVPTCFYDVMSVIMEAEREET